MMHAVNIPVVEILRPCSVPCSYSMGMGLVAVILGRDHMLNIPNSYFGILIYPLLLILGEHTAFEHKLQAV